jgi:hypothetical protein
MPSPLLVSTSPGQCSAEGAGFTLTLNGANFGSDVVAYWGTTALTTVFVNQGQATASVTAALIQDQGSIAVTVQTGGQTSGAVNFIVSAPAGGGPQPNAIDLVSISQVKNYLYPVTGTTADDSVLQVLVTAVSQYIATRTNRTALAAIQNFSERYDGNNADILYLRNYPVQSVSLVQIYSQQILPTPDYIAPGWSLNSDNTAIVLIGVQPPISLPFGVSIGQSQWGNLFGSASCPSVFPRDRMNVLVQYAAGYSVVPYDLQECCLIIIAQNYKRRGWIDEASKALPQSGGTSSYRKWEIPPYADRTLANYTNRWIY